MSAFVHTQSADDLRVIVVAPFGRDGKLICDVLARCEINTVQCATCDAASRQAANGAGSFVVAAEVLRLAEARALIEFVSQQPSWSDIPIIILTSRERIAAPTRAEAELHERLGNVLLVERPVRPETLISTVKSAMRARLRQYEVREHLHQEKLAAEALRQSEKLAVAGRLAASIAHEINNPLEAITNLHYLIRGSTSLEQVRQYLAIADEELARVTEIAVQTLRFHRESTRPVVVSVNEVLDSVLKLYSRRLKSNGITVERLYASGASVVGFGGELRQLFANLVSNAADSMRSGGTLTIRVRNGAESLNCMRQGIRVTVADTGVGIPPEIRPKIFNPFVSTKGTGTGLGLWVSAEIVNKHKGRIQLKSSPGKGTVFSVFLPTGDAGITQAA